MPETALPVSLLGVSVSRPGIGGLTPATRAAERLTAAAGLLRLVSQVGSGPIALLRNAVIRCRAARRIGPGSKGDFRRPFATSATGRRSRRHSGRT